MRDGRFSLSTRKPVNKRMVTIPDSIAIHHAGTREARTRRLHGRVRCETQRGSRTRLENIIAGLCDVGPIQPRFWRAVPEPLDYQVEWQWRFRPRPPLR